MVRAGLGLDPDLGGQVLVPVVQAVTTKVAAVPVAEADLAALEGLEAPEDLAGKLAHRVKRSQRKL